MIELEYSAEHPDVEEPTLASNSAACFDVRAWMPSSLSDVVRPGEAVIVHTGLSFAIPKGWCMEVFSRSGHGAKFRVSLANGTGIIDSDYRGELMIALANDSRELFTVRHGDRIAQFKLVEVPAVHLHRVAALDTTERGSGGFGSTGN